MTTLHLEVNDAGGWRRVMSFARDGDTLGDVMYDAHKLLMLGLNATKIRARIIEPGNTAPLMTWTQKDGWRDWPRGD